MLTRRVIARQRLANQHLTEPILEKPSEVVSWLGAVQAQDYAGAKWAVAQRTRGIVDATIEQALTDGTIVRTHVLRPTWHFVTAADVRWMLALTAPRVHASNAYRYRQLELDAAVFRRSNAALTRALRGGKQLTRAELADVLERAGIVTKEPSRLGYLLMRAELDGIVCSGARRGKQFTYALLDERVPQAKALERDEALFELTKRYFTTRGPATLRDFAWWSGLTMADAKRGVEMAESDLEREIVEGKPHWFPASVRSPKEASHTAHLLPNYDEYFIGFRDRSAIGEVVKSLKEDPPSNAFNAHVIVIDGQLVGGWRRTLKANAVVVELSPITRLTKADRQAVVGAARKYGAFLELPVELV